MKLKKFKKIVLLTVLFNVVCFFLVSSIVSLDMLQISDRILYLISGICGVTMVGIVIFMPIIWRCPHCNRFLGLMTISTEEHCPYCGENIFED